MSIDNQYVFWNNSPFYYEVVGDCSTGMHLNNFLLLLKLHFNLEMWSKISNIVLCHCIFSTFYLADQGSANDEDWIFDKNAAVLSQRIIYAMTTDWIVLTWIRWLFDIQKSDLLVELRGFHHIQIHLVKCERVVHAADDDQIRFQVARSRAAVC